MAEAKQVQVNHGNVVFGKHGLLILLAVAAVAIWHSFYAVGLVCATLACIWSISRIWTARVLIRLQMLEAVSRDEVFPFETVDVQLTIENNKWLPVPWLDLNPDGSKLPFGPHLRLKSELGHRFSWLFGKDARQIGYTVQPVRRGVYAVGPQLVRGGDPFAFFYRENRRVKPAQIVVYPSLLTSQWQDLQRRDPMGDKPDLNFLFTDPLMVAGVTDYQPSDPIRKINWIASARFQSLKSNIWEGKAAAKCTLFLETAGLQTSGWPEQTKQLAWEVLLSSVATQAMMLTEQGREWAFFTDAGLTGRDFPYFLVSSADNYGQQRDLLAFLAGLHQPETCWDLNSLLHHVKIRPASTVLVFCTKITPQLTAVLQNVAHTRKVVCQVLDLQGMHGQMPFSVTEMYPGWTDDLRLTDLLLGAQPVPKGDLPA